MVLIPTAPSLPPSFPGNPFPVLLSLALLCCPWFFLFLWAPSVPAGLCSLVSGSAIFCFFPGSLCFLWSRPLPCRLSGFGLCCVWLLPLLLPTSKFFFPGKPEVRFFSPQPLGLSLGGVPSLWQAELLASLGGMASSPRHVMGRRGPVQARPLPSCSLCLSASSQAPAEAGNP